MKLYISRKINRYFRKRNLRRVSDLKVGDEVSIAIEEADFYEGQLTMYDEYSLINTYPERLPCIALDDSKDMYDMLVSINGKADEWIEKTAVGSFNGLGLSLAENNEINLRSLVTTITPSLLSYIIRRYDANDILEFKSACTIRGKQGYKEGYGIRLFYMDEPLFCYIVKNELVTDIEVTDFYKLVTDKLLKRFGGIKLDDGPDSSTDDMMEFYKQVMLHKNEPDKVYLAIENILINEDEIPMFLLDGRIGITDEECPKMINIMSKIFS